MAAAARAPLARGLARTICGPLASALFGAACLPDVVFHCESADQCAPLGDTARCERTGWCSEADDACPSRRRYHEYAGDGLADACTEPGGQELWIREEASPGFVPDRAYSIASDSLGNAVVIGHVSVAGAGQDIWVRKYDPEGDHQWTWTLGGTALLDEEGWSVLVDRDDEFLVTGYITEPTTGHDAWVGKLGADGILVWRQQWDGGSGVATGGSDQIRDAVIADDGDIVVIGPSTIDGNLEQELWMQRRSPRADTVRWTKTWTGWENNAQDRAHGLALAGTDFIGVGMRQTAAEGQFAWIARVDALGNEMWSEQKPRTGPMSVWTAVAVEEDGDILLAGFHQAPAGDVDMWLQRRAPEGDVLWEEFVASPGGDDDKANALVVDPLGGFLVAGEMGAGAGSTDAWIRRYDAHDVEVWTVTYSGPAGARDTAWGLALDPDGNVLACGYQSDPSTEWDIWVRKLTP
jgi:uncharacterized delta-60 repeat protein